MNGVVGLACADAALLSEIAAFLEAEGLEIKPWTSGVDVVLADAGSFEAVVNGLPESMRPPILLLQTDKCDALNKHAADRVLWPDEKAIAVSRLKAYAVEYEAYKSREDQKAAFAAFGHDLKTPLGAIIGFADALRSDVIASMPEENRRFYADSIHDGAHYLLRLADHLLAYGAAGFVSGRERGRVEKAVARAAAFVSKEAEKKNVRIAVNLPGDAVVTADMDALTRLFSNLFSNAIKFSPEGGCVDALARRDADGALIIAVTDEGGGAHPDDLARLAEPFFRGASTEQGTGLGLAIADAIARAHGGRLSLANRAEGGLEAAVIFPADAGDKKGPTA